MREIVIPKVIDDYNNWMNGVDKADQLISNYRHNLRCRRIWLPLVFHALDVLRINAFIIFNGLVDKEKQLDQKDFVMAMVEKMIERAMVFKYEKLTKTTVETVSQVPTPHQSGKRKRMSRKNLHLPLKRLLGSPKEHACVIVKKNEL